MNDKQKQIILFGLALLLYVFIFSGVGPWPEPGPGPGPDPDPGPPGDKPIGMLVIYESETKHLLTPDQRGIIDSLRIKDYGKKHCNNGLDLKILDDDERLENVTDEKWRKAMSRKRDGDLWLIISNGRYGVEGIPKDVDQVLELAEKVRTR